MRDHVCALLLSTPVHDLLPDSGHDQRLSSRAVRLFDRVGRTGGEDTADGELRTEAEQLLQEAWDRLHAGDRCLAIRYSYATAAVSKALVVLSSSRSESSPEEMREALRCLDMALIMSPPLASKALTSAASLIHERLPTSSPALASKISAQDVVAIRQPIVEEENIQVLRFEREYYRRERCVVIRRAAQHWPALDAQSGRKWSLEYLCRRAGHRTVPVEVGKRYTDSTWTQKLMTVNEFVRDYVACEGRNDAEAGYLAQHDWFKQIPDLRKDISVPEFCSISRDCCDGADEEEEGGSSVDVDVNVWFGPRATVSPLHFDQKDNILVQVTGCKYVRIYDKAIPRHVVCPHAAESLMSNTSQVDVEDVDPVRFPDFARSASQFMTETILSEGDALFIPRKTWHFVKSLSVSASVSFWGT